MNSFATVAGIHLHFTEREIRRELDPSATSTVIYTALDTALSFATDDGQCNGYVFDLWVLVSPKAAAELPGFAEEIRELNLFSQYAVFHDEGEIAAKLFVPARQIQSVEKFDKNLNSLGKDTNSSFVSPERISNVLEFL